MTKNSRGQRSGFFRIPPSVILLAAFAPLAAEFVVLHQDAMALPEPIAATSNVSRSARAKICRVAQSVLFRRDPEFAHQSHASLDDPADDSRLVDFLFAAGDGPGTPDAVFARLRWGGQFVYVSPSKAEVLEAEKRFHARAGFVLEKSATYFRVHPFTLPLPFLAKTLHYFIARKTLLVTPGQSSDRFTYHVELLKHKTLGREYVVMKQVPTLDRVLLRLREKFPEAALDTLRKRARKFTDKIFPVFLTREAAILGILQKALPEPYKSRVPKVLAHEKDAHGFVRTLYLSWLRNTTPDAAQGHPLGQLDFALQAAELLHAIHDTARVIHLDLRLDNFVITRQGVGFVDFGSAVRDDEILSESTLLSSLFQEMMRTSQIQRMLGQMQDSGQVTSSEIRNSYNKVDKAVDFFYLAVQINAPHGNPDFKGLVDYDPESEEARQIAALTGEILRPSNPDQSHFKSAKDILEGLREIQRHLPPGPRRPQPAPLTAPA